MSFTPTPTTASQVGIVYSTVNKHMRRHVYVDSDAEWPQIQATLAPGESLAFVPMSAHMSGHDTFHQAIATAIGVPTAAQLFTDPRCVVIDNTNTVVNVIMADAGIDTLPNVTLINHQIAQIGHTYDPVLKQFTAPGYTLPIKQGVRTVAEVIPAAVFT